MKISIEYLNRESANSSRSAYWQSAKGESVYEWVINYLKRNKIKFEEGEYISINFKSQKQMDCFLWRGNEIFPYFEFL